VRFQLIPKTLAMVARGGGMARRRRASSEGAVASAHTGRAAGPAGEAARFRLAARLHRRYQIVAAARRQRLSPRWPRVGCDVTTAYHWVARFNTSGFAAFERPSNPRGRIPIVTAEQLRELMDVALSSPASAGSPSLSGACVPSAHFAGGS
jgi:hypothetical protein